MFYSLTAVIAASTLVSAARLPLMNEAGGLVLEHPATAKTTKAHYQAHATKSGDKGGFGVTLSMGPPPMASPLKPIDYKTLAISPMPGKAADLEKKAKSPIPVEEGFGKALVFTLDEVSTSHEPSLPRNQTDKLTRTTTSSLAP
jgi:hypothetical protein